LTHIGSRGCASRSVGRTANHARRFRPRGDRQVHGAAALGMPIRVQLVGGRESPSEINSPRGVLRSGESAVFSGLELNRSGWVAASAGPCAQMAQQGSRSPAPRARTDGCWRKFRILIAGQSRLADLTVTRLTGSAGSGKGRHPRMRLRAALLGQLEVEEVDLFYGNRLFIADVGEQHRSTCTQGACGVPRREGTDRGHRAIGPARPDRSSLRLTLFGPRRCSSPVIATTRRAAAGAVTPDTRTAPFLPPWPAAMALLQSRRGWRSSVAAARGCGRDQVGEAQGRTALELQP